MAAESVSCASCRDVTDEERYAQLDDVLAQYQEVPGALIPVLQIAQAMFGYLPDAALRRISVALGKPYSEVAGVVGFYSFFTTVPRGKHLVRVCLGTACYVRGGKKVLAALRSALRVEVGETTPDQVFSLDVGRCFGACGLAPVIMIDDDVHERVRAGQLMGILEKYRASTKSEAAKRSRCGRMYERDHRQPRATDRKCAMPCVLSRPDAKRKACFRSASAWGPAASPPAPGACRRRSWSRWPRRDSVAKPGSVRWAAWGPARAARS